MGDDFKPCPFCGELSGLEIGRGTNDREGAPTWVYCTHCAAHGPWVYCSEDDAGPAVRAWNDRDQAKEVIGHLKTIDPKQCSMDTWNAVQDALEVLEQ